MEAVKDRIPVIAQPLSSAEQKIIASIRAHPYGTVTIQIRAGKPTLIKRETTELIDI